MNTTPASCLYVTEYSVFSHIRYSIAAAMLYLVCENTEYSVTYKHLAGVVFMNQQTIANSVKKLRGDLKKYKIEI